MDRRTQDPSGNAEDLQAERVDRRTQDRTQHAGRGGTMTAIPVDWARRVDPEEDE